ncbi:AAA family ATPase [Flagellimonas sp. S174]|uniref:AAA family ATPase n=1 Tax=Flagellimonas sp. S174 TaxID=3410790 RepID=UPI003BF47F0C
MIKIQIQKEPDFLSSQTVELAKEKMLEFFTSKNRSQKRYSWPFNKEIDHELKTYLHNIFYGKCGYCEIRIISPKLGTVDRYRPNNGVRDKKEYHQDLYWWLAFEWNNLVYSCKDCNQYKGNYFPVKTERVHNREDNLSIENTLLLNPYLDEPNEHFGYNIHGAQSKREPYLLYPLTEKGNQTIELLRLNRTNLIEGRKKAEREILNSIEQLTNDSELNNQIRENLSRIYELENFDEEFLSYKKWILLNELDSNSVLGNILGLRKYRIEEPLVEKIDLPSKETSFETDVITSDYFPIEYIHIKNFKSIDDLRIDFKDDELSEKSWLFLLGENGVGKSSILQAIAVGLSLDRKTVNSLIPSLIKKRRRTAEIILKERNSENIIKTTLIRKNNGITQSGKFNSYLIGYGSLRLSVDEAEISTKKVTSKVSYENLFKPTRALNDVTKWLRLIHRNDRDFFDRIAYSIKQLLPHDNSDTTISIKGNDIVLGNSDSLFGELSDGYKSTIILAIDIMMKLSDAHSDMDKMSGIVLIDELGNQLHPRWQMRIVKQLRKVFPNINFIVSTHHPLCLRGAKKDEILLLKNIRNEIVADSGLPDPASLRVDQILASEFFGLSSHIDPRIEAAFNRYYELLARNNNINDEENVEIYELKSFLKDKKQLGSSIREELMYTVIDKLLAEKVIYNKKSIARDSLKEEVIEKVKEIWENLSIESDD